MGKNTNKREMCKRSSSRGSLSLGCIIFSISLAQILGTKYAGGIYVNDEERDPTANINSYCGIRHGYPWSIYEEGEGGIMDSDDYKKGQKVRVESPWSVVIFRKKSILGKTRGLRDRKPRNSFNSSWEYVGEGILINNSTVLTNAKLVVVEGSRVSPENYQVFFGIDSKSYPTKLDTSLEDFSEISEIEYYHKGSRHETNNKMFNVAVLKLKSELCYPALVNEICTAFPLNIQNTVKTGVTSGIPRTTYPNDPVLMEGFGYNLSPTSYKNSTSKTLSSRLSSNLIVKDRAFCEVKWGFFNKGKGPFPHDMRCAVPRLYDEAGFLNPPKRCHRGPAVLQQFLDASGLQRVFLVGIFTNYFEVFQSTEIENCTGQSVYFFWAFDKTQEMEWIAMNSRKSADRTSSNCEGFDSQFVGGIEDPPPKWSTENSEVVCESIYVPKHTQALLTLPGSTSQYLLPATRNRTTIPAMTPGSKVTMRCDPYYYNVQDSHSGVVNMECLNSGLWDPPYQPLDCVPDCGRISPKIAPLIVNGWISSQRSWPWHGMLCRRTKDGIEYICGVTLITPSVVITAAHCVYSIEKRGPLNSELFRVVLGSSLPDCVEEDGADQKLVQRFDIDDIAMHESFNTDNFEGDIAILHLRRDAIFSDAVRSVCINNSRLKKNSSNGLKLGPGVNGFVAGFGIDESGDLSKSIRALGLPLISQVECSKSLDRGKIPDSQFCAGYKNGSATCPGDSGGGLVFLSNSTISGTPPRFYIKGIVSNSNSKERFKCNHDNYGVFTRVSYFSEWIQEQIDSHF